MIIRYKGEINKTIIYNNLMRERKYRYWDNKPFDEKPKMIYLDEPNISGGNDCVFCTGNKVYSKYWDFSDHCDCIYELTGVIVTEYTGLKDKNGVEIYEGDIVDQEIWVSVDKYERTIGEVKYLAPHFISVCGGELKGSQAKLNANAIVLGNIYANPELLK